MLKQDALQNHPEFGRSTIYDMKASHGNHFGFQPKNCNASKGVLTL